MFGGLAFMIGGHMAVSASRQGGLLLRVDPAQTEPCSRKARPPFEMRGRSEDGWLRVEPEGVVPSRSSSAGSRSGSLRELAATQALAAVQARSLPGNLPRSGGSRREVRFTHIHSTTAGGQMSTRGMIAALVSLGLGIAALGAPAALGVAPAGRSVLQSSSPAATSSASVAPTPSETPIDFDVGLELTDPAGAVALRAGGLRPRERELPPLPDARAVGEALLAERRPRSKPSRAWLRSQGITVEARHAGPHDGRRRARPRPPSSGPSARRLGEYRHARPGCCGWPPRR